jgi:hypothetical protein
VKRIPINKEIVYEIIYTKLSLDDEKFINFDELCSLICDRAEWWFDYGD